MTRDALPPRKSGRAWRILVRIVVALALVAAAPALAVWRAPLWVSSEVLRLQLLVAGIHSDVMTLDGAQLHYVEGGSGDPVVLVHGLGGSARQDWAALMPYLVRSGHHVYALDLFGFGESDRPADRRYAIGEQARLVMDFLDAKHLDRVVLGGESMGGWIAAKLALEQPRRVAKLMLFDSAGLTFKPNFDLGLFTPQTGDQVDALMAILLPHPPILPDYVKADLIRRTQRDGWVTRRALDAMTSGVDLLDQNFSELKMPMLIVWGKQDVLTPPTIGEAMHQASPQSILAVFDHCGHIAVQTCADRVGPLTVDFLGAIKLAAGSRIDVPADTTP